MAKEQSLVCISAPAGADLRTKQFYIVKIDSSGNAVLGAAKTDEVAGILQNTPNTNEAASIAILGRSKCVTGAAVTALSQVGSDADGKGTAITVAAGGTVYNYRVGIATTASTAANGIVEVLLRPGPLLV
jgi:hypothetical protein